LTSDPLVDIDRFLYHFCYETAIYDCQTEAKKVDSAFSTLFSILSLPLVSKLIRSLSHFCSLFTRFNPALDDLQLFDQDHFLLASGRVTVKLIDNRWWAMLKPSRLIQLSL
jgi:hypothetical protein